MYGRCFLILLFVLLAYGCVYPYPEAAHEIGRKYRDLFVEKGLCLKGKECFKVRSDGSPDHAIISIYESDSISALLIDEIIGYAIRFHEDQRNTIDIELNFYRESFRDHQDSVFGLKPSIKLYIRGV